MGGYGRILKGYVALSLTIINKKREREREKRTSVQARERQLDDDKVAGGGRRSLLVFICVMLLIPRSTTGVNVGARPMRVD